MDVQVGDQVQFRGPGGAYTPDPDADWHLLVGDESALPAIAASTEVLPAGARGHAIIEVEDASEEQPLTVPEDRKSTRLNSSHVAISYAVFCLKKKKRKNTV